MIKYLLLFILLIDIIAFKAVKNKQEKQNARVPALRFVY